MAKYKSLYLWMLLPMLFMQAGIFEDYWGDFTENAWSVHVHYWTGTVWYIFLIIQPYYATHTQLARHRTLGIVGMFMGGAVCLTALSMLYRDIETTRLIKEDPSRFGPFEGWFFFGVAALEIVMMVAFGYAVIMSIIERKQLDRHAWWLISTVFIIMMPALGRGIQNVHIAMQIKQWPNIDIMTSLYFTQFIIIAMLLGGAWKYQQLRHPATWLALGVNLVTLLLEPIGRSAAVQQFLQTMIKG
ncbi:MAG: hypothetical protein MUE38_11720 [Flavihumibacter sp.]|jgi:hypothetical protein|nr:hypothetical protein [Flavihumibacter sp.]